MVHLFTRNSEQVAAVTLVLPLLALLVIVTHIPCAVAATSISDPFAGIANAFATTDTAVHVRAVYEASQLTWTNTSSDSGLTPFESGNYVLCQWFASTTTPTMDANTAAVAAAWCGSSISARLVTQTVTWSTAAPPGLQLVDQSTNTYQGRAWDCLTYACDTENTISTAASAATAAATAPAAIGGLSVAAPCCGSTNSTFVLYNTRGLVVQADLLPVLALNTEALHLAQAYATAQATGSSSSAASLGSDSGSTSVLNLTNSMDYCLLRQLSPSMYGTDTEGYGHTSSVRGTVGDGGIVLPVNVSICGRDLSARIDTRHAALFMTGYTLILSTADGLEELSMPKELIESVAAWIAKGPGTASGTYAAADSLARAKSVCAWHYDAAVATTYRTGHYYDCTVSDSALLAHLPPLLVSVRNESIVDTEETNSSCSLAIDLTTSAVTADGAKLRFFSTGSMMQSLSNAENAMPFFENPPIVIGVQHLRGATLAVTRAAYVAKWSSFGFNLASGLPLLYLATPRGSAIVNHYAATSWYACVQSQACKKRQIFYPSLNRCATKECLNLFLYKFHADTFECTVRVSVVTLFAAMCFVLLVAEATVLYLRRSTEEAKEEHMRLVHAVQRREAGAQL